MEEKMSNNSFCNGPVDCNAKVVCMGFQGCIERVKKGNWNIVVELLFALSREILVFRSLRSMIGYVTFASFRSKGRETFHVLGSVSLPPFTSRPNLPQKRQRPLTLRQKKDEVPKSSSHTRFHAKAESCLHPNR
jgi:hypothetical protein